MMIIFNFFAHIFFCIYSLLVVLVLHLPPILANAENQQVVCCTTMNWNHISTVRNLIQNIRLIFIQDFINATTTKNPHRL